MWLLLSFKKPTSRFLFGWATGTRILRRELESDPSMINRVRIVYFFLCVTGNYHWKVLSRRAIWSDLYL